MRKRYLALILLMFFLAVAILACGGPKVQKITGTLESFSSDPPQVVVNGITFPLAAGMKKYADKAETGKMYEFTVDEHGNVIFIKPLETGE
jgi:hypothetical protein